MKSWGMDGHISYTQPLGDNDKYLIVRANYTQSMNKITNFEEDLKKYDYQSAVGYQSGVNRGLIALGLFKDQADIDNSPRQDFGNYLPGDIKYKDVNGDGIVNWDDIVPLKYSYVPQIQYGFATEFNWKNFNVSVLFEGVSRVTFFKGGNMYQPFSGSTAGNVITDFANPATDGFHVKSQATLPLRIRTPSTLVFIMEVAVIIVNHLLFGCLMVVTCV